MTGLAKIDAPALLPWDDLDDKAKGMLRQVCSAEKLSDAEFALLCEVARRSGLDPIRRQIYALKPGGKLTFIAGIDGFRATARRNGLAGIDEPEFDYLDPEKRIPTSCKVTVHRWGPHGQRESYTARRFMRECMKNTPIWKERPHDMLAKCTEAMAHRMAFSETTGGIYEHAELEGRTGVVSQQPSSAAELLAPIHEVEAEVEVEP